MFAKIADRAKNQLGITLNIDSKAKEYIIENGYDEKYGARPLRRTIQNDLEDRLAEEILDGNLQKNKLAKIGVKDDKIVIKK